MSFHCALLTVIFHLALNSSCWTSPSRVKTTPCYCLRLCLLESKPLGSVRLYPEDPRKGFNPQECWRDPKDPKQHPSSDAAPSPLCSKAAEGKECAVPCAPIAPPQWLGDRLWAHSQLFQEPRVAGEATSMCIHGLCALPLPCWETQGRWGCCSPGHTALLGVRHSMAGQGGGRLEGAESQSPRTQAAHWGGLRLGERAVRASALYCRPWELGTAPAALCALQPPSHTTPREAMAEGDPQVCHAHPAEMNFNEGLNVHGFGLEIEAHRVTGGF